MIFVFDIRHLMDEWSLMEANKTFHYFTLYLVNGVIEEITHDKDMVTEFENLISEKS